MTAPTATDRPATFADAEKILATALPGYEQRPQQQKLAAAVEEHIQNTSIDLPVSLMAQAPCGVGKSLGYLIPAILSGKPVVVSVTTKNLQDQLAKKDIPFLQEHLGIDFTWAVLKGRSNYLDLGIAAATPNLSDVPHLAQIIDYVNAHPEFDGLRESLPIEIDNFEWSRICASSDACTDAKCSKQEPGLETCFATKAIRKANASQLVVVNHSLLATDLTLSAAGIPRSLDSRELVVLDEAHEFEEVVANTIGFRIAERTFSALANNVRSFVASHATEDMAAVEAPCGSLSYAAAQLYSAFDEMNEFAQQHEHSVRIKPRQVAQFSDQFGALLQALTELADVWEEIRWEPLSGEQKIQRNRLNSTIFNLLHRTGLIISGKGRPAEEEHETYVRWIEVEKRNRDEIKVIKCAPISVAPFLREHLFERFPTVLVSATLTVNGSFSFLADRVGIFAPKTLTVDSPFDFHSHGLLYVPSHVPSPKKYDQWEAAATEEMVQLVQASRGRALLLFTSIAHMKRAAVALRRRIDEYTILVQGEMANDKLRDIFCEDTHSILLASKSFMTGFDAPGETLSLLVISKLPYAVPTEPVNEARMEDIERRGGNTFRDYTLPMMSLILQQAAGRLIRHTEDTGVVAVLDNRLNEGIKRDLPPFSRTEDWRKANEFLQFMAK